MEKIEKTVKVIGGVGDLWGGRQFRQQFRVIDKGLACYAINASAVPILVVRKHDKSNRQNES